MATDINKPVRPQVRSAPPVPKANNDAPAANSAAANDVPANNSVANTAAANNAPANNAAANDAAPVHETESKHHNQILGFFDGFAKEAIDTATGFYNLVTTNPITTAKGIVYMATHPRLAVQAITEPYTTAWKDGRYGELAGRASFQVLTILLTSGAFSKSNKGAQVTAKAAEPTQAAVQAAQQVTTDMAKDLAKRTAMRKAEEAGVSGAAKASMVRKLTTDLTPKFAENIAKRGLADKIAQSIAASGVSDDAIAKVMSAAGGKIPANKVYQFASAGMRAGLKPEQIASKMAEFGAMSTRKAASEFPVALRLMQAEGRTAAAIAAAASPASAHAVASEMQRLDRMVAGTSDDALKAGYQAQLDALKKATAANPRTQSLVTDILAGKNVGPAERRLATWGQQIDNAGNAIGEVGENISETGGAVRNFLDGPKTIGDYAHAIGSIPGAIGGVVESAYDGTINILKKGIAMLPDFHGFRMPNIAKIRVPSPWEIITAPVTVPLGTAKWALTHPGRAIGLAGTLGVAGNVGKMGNELSMRVEDPNEPTSPGYRYYELKEGDTLESIAERELGDANRWEDIYDANRELFDSLGQDGVIAAGTKIKIPTGDGANAPSGNDATGGAAAYKDALLKLIDGKAAEADPDTRQVLGQLRDRLEAMSPEEVLELKEELEAQGLVVPMPEAPANNAPANNAPANNAPANNAPANNAPGNNAPANNAPPANAPSNNGPTAPATGYTVKRGDTLTEIAQRELGTWQRWHEVVDLNKDKYPSLVTNPDFLAIGWQLKLPAKGAAPASRPAAPASPAKPARPAKPAASAPREPNASQRAQIVKQFNLEGTDANWRKFWQEVSAYPQTTIGPDAGTDTDRRNLQNLLGKLGFPVKVTGSYYEAGANGQPKVNDKGYPVSPTADAVIAFKRMAGITQSYNVTGADGKPVPDVNEYVDARTRETMAITLRLLQDQTVRGDKAMQAAVKEAARLQASSIGPEVGTPEARALVQQYLAGLGYKVKADGNFDDATVQALIDFKRKNNLASPFRNDRGQPVFTPYVDGQTAEALFQAATQAGDKKK